mmetsp:Transcript_101597/g.326510  ORF Transcript_101597/g.326510 Transcript_101597/m.326510 type:complete len:559 (+) Transcript_101597:164-1840(+)
MQEEPGAPRPMSPDLAPGVVVGVGDQGVASKLQMSPDLVRPSRDWVASHKAVAAHTCTAGLCLLLLPVISLLFLVRMSLMFRRTAAHSAEEVVPQVSDQVLSPSRATSQCCSRGCCACSFGRLGARGRLDCCRIHLCKALEDLVPGASLFALVRDVSPVLLGEAGNEEPRVHLPPLRFQATDAEREVLLGNLAIAELLREAIRARPRGGGDQDARGVAVEAADRDDLHRSCSSLLITLDLQRLQRCLCGDPRHLEYSDDTWSLRNHLDDQRRHVHVSVGLGVKRCGARDSDGILGSNTQFSEVLFVHTNGEGARMRIPSKAGGTPLRSPPIAVALQELQERLPPQRLLHLPVPAHARERHARAAAGAGQLVEAPSHQGEQSLQLVLLLAIAKAVDQADFQGARALRIFVHALQWAAVLDRAQAPARCYREALGAIPEELQQVARVCPGVARQRTAVPRLLLLLRLLPALFGKWLRLLDPFGNVPRLLHALGALGVPEDQLGNGVVANSRTDASADLAIPKEPRHVLRIALADAGRLWAFLRSRPLGGVGGGGWRPRQR